jgi:hypothetical protein
MFYLASSQSSVHNRLWRRLPAKENVVDSLSSAIVLFPPTITCSFLTTYFPPFRVSHGIIGIWCSLLLRSNKEEETCLIDFDMCDQHEAIV